MALTLTDDERTELERRRRSRRIRAEDARRAEVILMLADGASFTAIAAAVGCGRRTVKMHIHQLGRLLPGNGNPLLRVALYAERLLAAVSDLA